jgi:hypothetical protein
MQGSVGEGKNLHLWIFTHGIRNAQMEANNGKTFDDTRQGANGEDVQTMAV